MPNTLAPPLVSVLMPAYNHAPYVRAAVESVLGQTYDNLELIAIDGRRVQATLVNEDPRYDVAILRLPEGEKLPAVAPLADSSQLEPGMRVLAIGSPLGTDYQNTVTTGIIAGLNRRVKQQGFDLRTFEYRSLDVVDVPLIQTDAAINVGNSGGPLIDLKGEVVGLNTLVVRRDQNAGSAAIEGFGFSVPSNLIQALADSWIDGRPRGDLGLEAVELDPSFAREHGLSRAAGAVVQRLTAGAGGRAGRPEGRRHHRRRRRPAPQHRPRPLRPALALPRR